MINTHSLKLILTLLFEMKIYLDNLLEKKAFKKFVWRKSFKYQNLWINVVIFAKTYYFGRIKILVKSKIKLAVYGILIKLDFIYTRYKSTLLKYLHHKITFLSCFNSTSVRSCFERVSWRRLSLRFSLSPKEIHQLIILE